MKKLGEESKKQFLSVSTPRETQSEVNRKTAEGNKKYNRHRADECMKVGVIAWERQTSLFLEDASRSIKAIWWVREKGIEWKVVILEKIFRDIDFIFCNAYKHKCMIV